MTIDVGTRGEARMIVDYAKTALNVESGGVPVFSTPMLVAMCETACAASIKPFLESGQETVGTLVNISHLAATPIGQTVRAESEVTAVEGRKITFQVVAYDEQEKIGEGTHVRYIIDIERFMRRVDEKAQKS